VDKPLTVQDIMNMNRDQYEGTQFDLTKGPGGGPYGDPMRWPPMAPWEDEVRERERSGRERCGREIGEREEGEKGKCG